MPWRLKVPVNQSFACTIQCNVTASAKQLAVICMKGALWVLFHMISTRKIYCLLHRDKTGGQIKLLRQQIKVKQRQIKTDTIFYKHVIISNDAYNDVTFVYWLQVSMQN